MAVAVTTEGYRCPLWLHTGQISRSRFLRAFSDRMGSSTTKKFINRLNGIRKVKLNILTCFLRYLFSFDSELLNSLKCFQPTTGGGRRKWNGFDGTLLAPVKASKPPEGLRTKGPAGSKEQTPKRKCRLNAGPGAVKWLTRRAAPHLAANSEAPPPPPNPGTPWPINRWTTIGRPLSLIAKSLFIRPRVQVRSSLSRFV